MGAYSQIIWVSLNLYLYLTSGSLLNLYLIPLFVAGGIVGVFLGLRVRRLRLSVETSVLKCERLERETVKLQQQLDLLKSLKCAKKPLIGMFTSDGFSLN